jgi:hypothetical protein
MPAFRGHASISLSLGLRFCSGVEWKGGLVPGYLFRHLYPLPPCRRVGAESRGGSRLRCRGASERGPGEATEVGIKLGHSDEEAADVREELGDHGVEAGAECLGGRGRVLMYLGFSEPLGIAEFVIDGGGTAGDVGSGAQGVGVPNGHHTPRWRCRGGFGRESLKHRGELLLLPECKLTAK